VVPLLADRLREARLDAHITVAADTVDIAYEAQAAGSGYVRPVVVLEFGARSTGEPSERRDVTCDAARYVPDVVFPAAAPSVMRPERTFWEKATAIHVFYRGGRFRGAERFSRHWYDIVALDRATFVDAAIRDRELARRVARHKSMFFRETDEHGRSIEYEAAVNGALQLVPDGASALRPLQRFSRTAPRFRIGPIQTRVVRSSRCDVLSFRVALVVPSPTVNRALRDLDRAVPKQCRDNLDGDALEEQGDRKCLSEPMRMPTRDGWCGCCEDLLKHAIPALDHALPLPALPSSVDRETACH